MTDKPDEKWVDFESWIRDCINTHEEIAVNHKLTVEQSMLVNCLAQIGTIVHMLRDAGIMPTHPSYQEKKASEKADRLIRQTESRRSWVGVDLDGTLAHYDGWQGIEHIGPAIPKMMERVRILVKEGIKVKIFTARVSEGPEAVRYIKAWLLCYGLDLEVTNAKDMHMIELYDDRAVPVEKNTGELLREARSLEEMKGWSEAPPPPSFFKGIAQDGVCLDCNRRHPPGEYHGSS